MCSILSDNYKINNNLVSIVNEYLLQKYVKIINNNDDVLPLSFYLYLKGKYKQDYITKMDNLYISVRFRIPNSISNDKLFCDDRIFTYILVFEDHIYFSIYRLLNINKNVFTFKN